MSENVKNKNGYGEFYHSGTLKGQSHQDSVQLENPVKKIYVSIENPLLVAKMYHTSHAAVATDK